MRWRFSYLTRSVTPRFGVAKCTIIPFCLGCRSFELAQLTIDLPEHQLPTVVARVAGLVYSFNHQQFYAVNFSTVVAYYMLDMDYGMENV